MLYASSFIAIPLYPGEAMGTADAHSDPLVTAMAAVEHSAEFLNTRYKGPHATVKLQEELVRPVEVLPLHLLGKVLLRGGISENSIERRISWSLKPASHK